MQGHGEVAEDDDGGYKGGGGGFVCTTWGGVVIIRGEFGSFILMWEEDRMTVKMGGLEPFMGWTE